MNKQIVNLATPTSHLFKSEVNAQEISEKSDCLELREFMIGKLDSLNENIKFLKRNSFIHNTSL